MVAGVLRSIIVIWLVLTFVFVALRLLPGNAITADGAYLTPQQVEQRRQQLGLDDPILVQYRRYLGDVLRGDWGQSLISSENVSSMIMGRLGPTLALGMGAFAVALGGGFGLGIAASIDHPAIRTISTSLITLAQALPIYVSALMAIYIFSLGLNWLPAGGSASPLHLILPCGVLGFHAASSIAAILRANLQAVYAMPHMLTARAKGLYPVDLLDHALRLAILPTLSTIALQAGFLLGGTVIIEVIFVRRGLGSLMFDAVLDRDYPVVQALAILGALVYVLAVGTSRVLQRLLDPRPNL